MCSLIGHNCVPEKRVSLSSAWAAAHLAALFSIIDNLGLEVALLLFQVWQRVDVCTLCRKEEFAKQWIGRRVAGT